MAMPVVLDIRMAEAAVELPSAPPARATASKAARAALPESVTHLEEKSATVVTLCLSTSTPSRVTVIS